MPWIMKTYEIIPSPGFLRDYKKYRRDNAVKKQVRQVFKLLKQNPFKSQLRTHRVNVPSLGFIYSSRVTGDIRLLWEFDEENHLVIIALRLRGHDNIYK